MHVHLLVPDLLVPKPAASGMPADLSFPPPPPPLDALETLLARGRRKAVPAASLEAWLCGRYGLADAGATAAFSLLGDGGEPGAAVWMRAEPVHLRADRDALVLADASVFTLTSEEAHALAASLNRHFAPDLSFDPVTPARWYVRLDATSPLPRSLHWTSLAAARGHPLAPSLPRGDGAMRWNARVNEMQMLLHDHPVNAGREARGELPVNSVWLWGEGVLAEPAARPWGSVFADEPLARGLAKAAGGSAAPLPADATALLGDAPAAGQVLVVLDALRAATAYADADTWAAQLARLEHDWFAPLLAALRAGRIGMLTLTCLGAPAPDGQVDDSGTPDASAEHGSAGLDAEVTRGDLRRFWRRRRPLGHYAGTLRAGTMGN